MKISDQLDAVKLLAEHELVISRLYLVYATDLPDYRDFWYGLVNDEKEHAHWINRLIEDIASGKTTINPARFNITGIQASMSNIYSEIARANSEEITAFDALTVALGVEGSLIENKYFEVFDSDSKMIKLVFLALKSGTVKHQARIRKEWERTK